MAKMPWKPSRISTGWINLFQTHPYSLFRRNLCYNLIEALLYEVSSLKKNFSNAFNFDSKVHFPVIKLDFSIKNSEFCANKFRKSCWGVEFRIMLQIRDRKAGTPCVTEFIRRSFAPAVSPTNFQPIFTCTMVVRVKIWTLQWKETPPLFNGSRSVKKNRQGVA